MAGTSADDESVIRDQIQRLYQADADGEARLTEQRIAQRLQELEKRGVLHSSIAHRDVIGIVREEGLRLVDRRLEITKEVLQEAGKELDLERMALIETDIRDLVDRWTSGRVPYVAKWLADLRGGMPTEVAERTAAHVRLKAKHKLAVMRGGVRLAAIRNESRAREEPPAGRKTQRSSLREWAANNAVPLLVTAALTFLGLAIVPLCGGEGGPVAAIVSLALAGICGAALSVLCGAISTRKGIWAVVGVAWLAFLVAFGFGVPRISAAVNTPQYPPPDFRVSLDEVMPVSVAGYPYGCVLVGGSVTNRGADGQAQGMGVNARLADGTTVGGRPQEPPKRLTVGFADGTVTYFREDALKRFEASPVGGGRTVYGVMLCYFPGVTPRELADGRTSYWLTVRDGRKEASSALFAASRMPRSVVELRHLPGVKMEITNGRTGKTITLE